MPPKKRMRGTDAVEEEESLRNLRSDLNLIPPPSKASIIHRPLSQTDLLSRFAQSTSPSTTAMNRSNQLKMTSMSKVPSTMAAVAIKTPAATITATSRQTPAATITTTLRKTPAATITQASTITGTSKKPASATNAATANPTNSSTNLQLPFSKNITHSFASQPQISAAMRPHENIIGKTWETVSSLVTTLDDVSKNLSDFHMKFQQLESSQKDLKEKIEELISNQETTNESLYQLIKNQDKELVPTIPEFLPFRTKEEMESFVDFDDLVRFLKYKGDSFIDNCAKRFLEVAFDKNDQLLIESITWVGTIKGKTGLKKSKFMKACIIAIRSNVFPKPTEKQIDFAFQKALKAMKERVRKSNKNLNTKKIDDYDKENERNNANSNYKERASDIEDKNDDGADNRNDGHDDDDEMVDYDNGQLTDDGYPIGQVENETLLYNLENGMNEEEYQLYLQNSLVDETQNIFQ